MHADVEDREDVGVREHRGGARFALEPRQEIAYPAAAADDLDRDVPAESRIPGPVDLRPASRADLLGRFVGPRRVQDFRAIGPTLPSIGLIPEITSHYDAGGFAPAPPKRSARSVRQHEFKPPTYPTIEDFASAARQARSR